jgi:polyisoprenoid-binding protein YceI
MTRRTRWVAGITVVVVLLLGGAGVALWQVFGGDTAPRVALTSLVPSSTASASASSGTGSGADGTWTIDDASGSLADGSSTYAGYRVQEQFSGIGANTVVGRTQNVRGSMTIHGTTITALDVTVDMTTLQSDKEQRDNSLRERGLETDRFPTATFTLTQPIDVGDEPKDGQTIDVTAVGDLTLHGVTNQVSVPIQAVKSGGQIQAIASLDVALADYGIDPPIGFLVVSIADTGTIELHLVFHQG